MQNDLTLADFSQLLSFLYDGHIEESPYSQFLDRLREVLELKFVSMTLREPIDQDGGLIFVSTDAFRKKAFIDDHDNPYTDRYYTTDPMTNLPWGKVVSMDELMSYASFENSDLYKLCMQPIGIYHMAGVDLRNANGQRFKVRFCRDKPSPNFNQQERDFIAMLAPHIQRAVASGMQLIQLDNERKLYSKTISGLSIGIITLDERAKVIQLNRAAEDFVAEKDGISIVNEQLHLSNSNSRQLLNEHIADVIDAQRNQQPPAVHALSTERISGKSNLEILIKPMSVDKTVESTHTPHLMIFISDTGKKYEIDINMLMSLYHLTRAEALLAKHLAAGDTLDQSAAQLGIARNTARAQLRSIFAKTGVTQQSMLVSLIMKSLATLS